LPVEPAGETLPRSGEPRAPAALSRKSMESGAALASFSPVAIRSGSPIAIRSGAWSDHIESMW